MIRLLIVIFFCLTSPLSYSQHNSFENIDQQMIAIPASMEKSSELIAQYINKKFDTENDKIRAVFFWTAENINYDHNNLNNRTSYKGKQDLIDEVLLKRKALCEGYALLFTDLAKKVGINSYLVSGYTKQNGKLDEIGHAWCVAKIDSQWYVFDPTWGSGHILNSTQYIKAINDDYFKIDPKIIISSHMPIDPVWQLLYYPISVQAFYDGKTTIDSSKVFFNYVDSIAIINNLPKFKHYKSALRRIAKREIKNHLIEDYINYLNTEIDYFQNHTNIENFNLAIDNYNLGVGLYNDFLLYRSRGFKPKKSNKEITEMLVAANSKLNLAMKQLEIKNPKIELGHTITDVRNQIEELFQKIKKQQDFLEKHLQ